MLTLNLDPIYSHLGSWTLCEHFFPTLPAALPNGTCTFFKVPSANPGGSTHTQISKFTTVLTQLWDKYTTHWDSVLHTLWDTGTWQWDKYLNPPNMHQNVLAALLQHNYTEILYIIIVGQWDNWTWQWDNCRKWPKITAQHVISHITVRYGLNKWKKWDKTVGQLHKNG